MTDTPQVLLKAHRSQDHLKLPTFLRRIRSRLARHDVPRKAQTMCAIWSRSEPTMV